MWHIQTIPTAEMYVFRGGTLPQEEFLDVQADPDFLVADSLEYVFGSEQSDTLGVEPGTFSVAFEDANVYQTGNETLGVETDTFSVTDEHVYVEAAAQAETLGVEAGTFSVTDEFMFVDPGAQAETLGAEAGTFSVTVSP